jgi:hypothetical protein
MPAGPGRYDDLATEAREKAGAEGVLLLIVNGKNGMGFSVQGPLPFLYDLPRILRRHEEGVSMTTIKKEDHDAIFRALTEMNCPQCLSSDCLEVEIGGRKFAICRRCQHARADWMSPEFRGHGTNALAETIQQLKLEGMEGAMKACLAYVLIYDYWLMLRKLRPGADRAAVVNGMINEAIGENDLSGVSCRKGCSFCCYMYVAASPDEAALLRETGVEIDPALQERQLVTEKEWHNLRYRHKRCLYLAEDGTCKVYENRPSACRKYLVTSDPRLCDIRTPGRVDLIAIHEAEFIASAQLNLFEGIVNIATALKGAA